jgi:predicted membrane-bound spermidine synthase
LELDQHLAIPGAADRLTVGEKVLIIGIYLSALGVGAWLSGFIDEGLARRFIEVEIGVALLGGLSAPLLFLSFARLSFFSAILYGLVFLIGASMPGQACPSRFARPS